MITEAAEERKQKKYLTLSENYFFVPIAINTFKGYGLEARHFIREIETGGKTG